MIFVMPHKLLPGAKEVKETPDVNEIVKAIEDFIDAKIRIGENHDAVAFCRKKLSDILYGEIISKRELD
jgi:hypothetical protein